MVSLDSKIVLALFASIILVLFSLFAPDYPVFGESISFLLGVKHFSLVDGAPEAPGRYFYAVVLRGASAITGNGFEGMLLVSRIALLLAMWGVYRAASFLHGRSAGLLAILLLLAHPFVFISAIGGDPSIMAVAVCSVGTYLGVRMIRDPDPVGLFRFSLLYGFSGGFSFVAFVSLSPLWLLLMYRAKNRREPLLASMVVVIAGLALWIIPSVSSANGFGSLMRLSFLQSTYITSGNNTDMPQEYLKALAIGALLYSMLLVLLLNKTKQAYRGRMTRYSLALSLPLIVVSLFQVFSGKNPDALAALVVPLAVFVPSTASLVFDPENSISGRKSFYVLGAMSILPGFVFGALGGSGSNTPQIGFHVEQWSLRAVNAKSENAAQIIDILGQEGLSSFDSVFVIADSKTGFDARLLAWLLYPAEVYSFPMYYNRHRRFISTELEIETKGKFWLYIGSHDLITGNLPETKKRAVLSDGSSLLLVPPSQNSAVRQNGAGWIYEKR